MSSPLLTSSQVGRKQRGAAIDRLFRVVRQERSVGFATFNNKPLKSILTRKLVVDISGDLHITDPTSLILINNAITLYRGLFYYDSILYTLFDTFL